MFGVRETLLLGEWGEGPLSHVMEIILSFYCLQGHYASGRGTYLINELPSSRGRMVVEERDETRNEHSMTGHAAESNHCRAFGGDGVTKAQQHPTNACTE
jgi:hypothetical protein